MGKKWFPASHILAQRALTFPHDIIFSMLPDLELDDVVRLRKPHPCGSYTWKIVRLGADIGLECLGCCRRVLLPRRELSRRLKALQSKPTTNGDEHPAR